MSAEKEFFWKDLSGRGFTNTFTQKGLIEAFKREHNYDGESIRTWTRTAEVGDEWNNAANKVIRTK